MDSRAGGRATDGHPHNRLVPRVPATPDWGRRGRRGRGGGHRRRLDLAATAEPRSQRIASGRQPAGKITFALSADDLVRVQPLVADYQQANGVTIEIQTFPYASLYEKLNIDLVQATGAYDVVSMDDPWMPIFAGGQFLKDLGPLMEAKGIAPDPDIVPELYALGEFPAGSGQRGIPWIGSVQVFAYRTDVVQELGLPVPATWDEVLANAEAITAARSAQDLYGFGLRGQPGNPAVTSFLPVLRGYGADIFASDAVFEPQLETDQARQAMATFLALSRLAPPGVEAVGHEENGRNMYTGRTAQSGDIWPDQLLKMYDPELSVVVGKVDVGAEPAQPGAQPANMTGNWLLGIPEGSTNPDLALDFILWMTAPEQQKRLLLNHSLQATRVSVLEDPEAVERLPFLPGLLAAARNAVPRPRTEFYPAVEDILGRHVAAAIVGQMSGDEALTVANREIRDMMVREGVLQG
jgi:multiple sugar transport system substrate-binding protein